MYQTSLLEEAVSAGAGAPLVIYMSALGVGVFGVLNLFLVGSNFRNADAVEPVAVQWEKPIGSIRRPRGPAL